MAKNNKVVVQKYGNQAAKRLADEVKKANKTTAAQKEIAQIKKEIQKASQSNTLIDLQL